MAESSERAVGLMSKPAGANASPMGGSARSNDAAAAALGARGDPDTAQARPVRDDWVPPSFGSDLAIAASTAANPAGSRGLSGSDLSETRRIAPRSPRAALEPERVPMPIRWSKSARHPLVIAGNAVFTVLILIAVVGGIIFAVAKNRFDAAGPLQEDKIVNIPPRLGIRDIADLLVKEGVIEHPLTFIMSAMLAKTREELRFGEYQFTKLSSFHDVINTIIEGKVVQHQFTIAEGLTSEQIVQRLLENDILSGNIKEIPREGSMLPESYRFTRGTARDQVI